MTEALHVNAGRVTFEVRAPGHVTELRQESVPGGAESLVRVTVTLTPSPTEPSRVVTPPVISPPPMEGLPGPTPTPLQPAPTSRPWFAIGLAATGVGVAGLVVGVAGLLVRNGHATEFNDNPRCGVANDVVVGGGDCQSAYDAREPAQTLSTVGFVAGGALLAVGVTALVMNARSASPRPRAVSVTGAPGDLGVGLRVGFW
jgi:hypothetical protein